MSMRNFWIHGEIDGRKAPMTGGPQRKDGGFSMVVRMRDAGASVMGLRIEGFVAADGKLVIMATTKDGESVSISTDR